MADAKKLADQFQEQVIAVMLEKQRARREENKVIYAKDLEGTKPKKRTDKPSNFVLLQRLQPRLLATV